MQTKTIHMGKSGQLVIPKAMREKLGLSTGRLVLIECEEDGLYIRPAEAVPVSAAKLYSPEQKARFVLEDAVDAAGYAEARRLVQEMGLNPDAVAHERSF